MLCFVLFLLCFTLAGLLCFALLVLFCFLFACVCVCVCVCLFLSVLFVCLFGGPLLVIDMTS